MGVNLVSDLQVPDGNFTALIEARPNKAEKQNEKVEGVYFDFIFNPPCKPGKLKNSLEESNLENEQSFGLRKRFVSGKDSTEDDEERDNSMTEQGQNSSDFRPDPLKWFGVLTPSALKQGQHYFQSAARTAVELANHKVKLNGIIDEYMRLKHNKDKLLSHVDTISSMEQTEPK